MRSRRLSGRDPPFPKPRIAWSAVYRKPSMIDLGVLALARLPVLANSLVLMVFVLAAAMFDIAFRKIPNWLILAGLGLSLGMHLLASDLAMADWGLGLLVGFGAFLPLYVIRVMGAGDVKLVAAAGAFVGPQAACSVILFSLVAGGLLVVLVAGSSGTLRRVIDNAQRIILNGMSRLAQRQAPTNEAPVASVGNLPYGVAIAGGTLVYLLFPGSLVLF